MDGALVQTFIYQCELYFAATGMTDDGRKGAFAALLLVGDASTWLQSKYTSGQLQSLGWSQLSTEILSAFKPVDSKRRARDALAACT